MNEIYVICALAGFLLGEIFGLISSVCIVHKKFYNTYIIKLSNLPLSTKIKKHFGMKEGEYL